MIRELQIIIIVHTQIINNAHEYFRDVVTNPKENKPEINEHKFIFLIFFFEILKLFYVNISVRYHDKMSG